MKEKKSRRERVAQGIQQKVDRQTHPPQPLQHAEGKSIWESKRFHKRTCPQPHSRDVAASLLRRRLGGTCTLTTPLRERAGAKSPLRAPGCLQFTCIWGSTSPARPPHPAVFNCVLDSHAPAHFPLHFGNNLGFAFTTSVSDSDPTSFPQITLALSPAAAGTQVSQVPLEAPTSGNAALPAPSPAGIAQRARHAVAPARPLPGCATRGAPSRLAMNPASPSPGRFARTALGREAAGRGRVPWPRSVGATSQRDRASGDNRRWVLDPDSRPRRAARHATRGSRARALAGIAATAPRSARKLSRRRPLPPAPADSSLTLPAPPRGASRPPGTWRPRPRTSEAPAGPGSGPSAPRGRGTTARAAREGEARAQPTLLASPGAAWEERAAWGRRSEPRRSSGPVRGGRLVRKVALEWRRQRWNEAAPPSPTLGAGPARQRRGDALRPALLRRARFPAGSPAGAPGQPRCPRPGMRSGRRRGASPCQARRPGRARRETHMCAGTGALVPVCLYFPAESPPRTRAQDARGVVFYIDTAHEMQKGGRKTTHIFLLERREKTSEIHAACAQLEGEGNPSEACALPGDAFTVSLQSVCQGAARVHPPARPDAAQLLSRCRRYRRRRLRARN